MSHRFAKDNLELLVLCLHFLSAGIADVWALLLPMPHLPNFDLTCIPRMGAGVGGWSCEQLALQLYTTGLCKVNCVAYMCTLLHAHNAQGSIILSLLYLLTDPAAHHLALGMPSLGDQDYRQASKSTLLFCGFWGT